jgi:hypothetical protein
MVAPRRSWKAHPLHLVPPVNPMANNVNMHPMDAAYGVGHAWRVTTPLVPAWATVLSRPTHKWTHCWLNAINRLFLANTARVVHAVIH